MYQQGMMTVVLKHVLQCDLILKVGLSELNPVHYDVRFCEGRDLIGSAFKETYIAFELWTNQTDSELGV